MKLVAIVTPTYNRAYILSKLFESLKQQTSKNFKWYIIDDGSTDNTEELVKTFNMIEFEIEYHKKDNGGKHTALNYAFDVVKEELTFIVDSDDVLTPDAIETIEKDWNLSKNDQTISALCYLRAYPDGKINGKNFSKDGLVDTFINERVNRGVSGDKAEVYVTKILNKYRFPVFAGEKFINEVVVWANIGRSYNQKYISKVIYVGDYLNDGLSHNNRALVLSNPRGAVEVYKELGGCKVNLKSKIKYMLAYIAYSTEAKVKFKEQFKKSNSKILYILLFLPGLFTHFILKKRYGKKK